MESVGNKLNSRVSKYMVTYALINMFYSVIDFITSYKFSKFVTEL